MVGSVATPSSDAEGMLVGPVAVADAGLKSYQELKESGVSCVVFHFVSTKFFRLFRCKAEEFCGLIHYCRKELQWRA